MDYESASSLIEEIAAPLRDLNRRLAEVVVLLEVVSKQTSELSRIADALSSIDKRGVKTYQG